MSRLLSRVPSVVTASLALLSLATMSPAAVKHNYLFNSGDGTQVIDTVGGANGVALDGAVVNVAESRLILNGTGAYAALPGPTLAINTYAATSLELWFTQSGNTNQFTAGAMLGRTSTGLNGESSGLGYDYLMLQPTRAPTGEGSRGALSNGTYNAEVGVTNGNKDLNDGRLHQMVLTVDSTTVGYYVDGLSIGTAPLNTFTLGNVSNDLAYLGRSLYNDPFFSGSIYEFRIYDTALTTTEVQTKFQAGCTASCGDPIRLEINRSTGEALFKNDLTTQSVVTYSVTSASGSINITNNTGWKPVADFGDFDSGKTIDPDDIWAVDTRTTTAIGETDPIGGGGPDNGFTVGPTRSLGNLFAKSPYQDLVVTATTYDGITESNITVPVIYTGTAIGRSDFNADGVLSAADYTVLLSNHLKALTGTTTYETFKMGDVDGDLDNDFNDFRLFKDDYIAANGSAAFAALAAIPEPTTAVLAAVAFGGLVGIRKRR